MFLARQLFVPAFFTLLLLGIAALWAADPAEPAAAVENAAVENAAAVAAAPSAAGSGLAFARPGTLLADFQQAHPAWARLLALLLLLLAGIALGRISVRAHLYGVNTCLALPLLGALLCLLTGHRLSLPLLLAVFLFAFSIKRFGEAFRDGYSFDLLFRASLALGVLILVQPTTLPLLLLLPFGVLLFERTRREAVVAVAGALFGPALLCYLNWSMGGTFTAPVVTLWHDFATGVPAALFRSGFAPWMGIAGLLLLADLGGIGSVSANFYSVGARARYILIFNIGALLLAFGLLCGPAASVADSALITVPSAVLLPFPLVRMRASLASLLYLLLLAVAIIFLLVPLF